MTHEEASRLHHEIARMFPGYQTTIRARTTFSLSKQPRQRTWELVFIDARGTSHTFWSRAEWAAFLDRLER